MRIVRRSPPRSGMTTEVFAMDQASLESAFSNRAIPQTRLGCASPRARLSRTYLARLRELIQTDAARPGLASIPGYHPSVVASPLWKAARASAPSSAEHAYRVDAKPAAAFGGDPKTTLAALRRSS